MIINATIVKVKYASNYPFEAQQERQVAECFLIQLNF